MMRLGMDMQVVIVSLAHCPIVSVYRCTLFNYLCSETTRHIIVNIVYMTLCQSTETNTVSEL